MALVLSMLCSGGRSANTGAHCINYELSVFEVNDMKPVFIDGLTYVLIAFFGAIASALGSDDAAKWIEAAPLWYAKNIATAIAASLLAMKMFRSTVYSNSLVEKAVEKAEEKAEENKPTVTTITR